MSIRPIRAALPGEQVVGLSPETAQDASQALLRRPHPFPGRALGAPALGLQQDWGERHVVLRGREAPAGIVQGLGVDAHLISSGDAVTGALLRVEPGRGVTRDGDDVVLRQALECRLDDLPVVAPAGFFVDGSRVDPGSEAQVPTLYPRQLGAAIGALGEAARAALPVHGVLLLQPVRCEGAVLDARDPCLRSAADEGTLTDSGAFEDWRSTDGVRLLWYVWPGEWRGLPGVIAAQMRNARAWQVFEAEAALGPAETLPWEPWGLALALVELDSGGIPLWLDRSAVARHGGRACESRLRPAPPRPGPSEVWQPHRLDLQRHLPTLWQARIEQLAEQIGAAGSPTPPAGELADAFGRRLPPVGLLPADAITVGNAGNPVAQVVTSEFFPPQFELDAVPVPSEQLDLALRASAGLAPLDPHAIERVQLLVPVPLASWEPELLMRASIDPLFRQTLDATLLLRARTIGLRQGLRQRAALLQHALTGLISSVPAPRDDPLALEPESLAPWGEPPPGGGHRSTLHDGLHQYFFDNASATFRVAAGEVLFVWACIDPDHPPLGLVFKWHVKAAGNNPARWSRGVCWIGTPAAPGAVVGGADLLAPRSLPAPGIGAWIRLDIPIAELGLAAGTELDGMAFVLQGGRAAFGLTGAATGSTWRKWFCNFLPAGARVQGDEPWELLTANDLWMPFEPRGGVVPSLPELETVDAGGSDPFGGAGAAAVRLAVPTGGINLYLPPAAGWRGMVISFQSAAGSVALPTIPTLPKQAGHRLQWWAYLDELQPPRSLWALLMMSGVNEGSISGVQYRIVYWGENRLEELDKLIPGLRNNESIGSPVRAGALPRAGTWVTLDIELPDGSRLGNAAQMRLFGLVMLTFDGIAAFSDLMQQPAGGTAQRIWPLLAPDGTTPLTPFTPYPPTAQVRLQNDLGVLTPTPSARIGTVEVCTRLAADATLQRLSPHEQSQLQLRGLQGFADYLRTRIDRADDITDFGFAHMQVDLHRIRQMMLSTTDTSRLAVSPALAAIAKSDSALTVQSQISEYLSRVKAGVVARATSTAGATATAAATVAKAATVTSSAALSSAATVQAAARASLIAPTRAQPEIIYAMPVVGLSEVRTAAIAERLRTPPSTEARDYALANRHRTVSSLLGLLDTFSAQDSGEPPSLFSDFMIPGLQGDAFLNGLPAGTLRRPLLDFRGNAALLTALLTPPPPMINGQNTTESEATLFTQTVALSDLTVAMLRQLESRLTLYRDALTRSESALTELQTIISAGTTRLGEVADALAEARHDVGVTRALMVEEQARIDAINARRARVLAEEVRFVAYVRPREADHLLSAPTHAIDPGLLDAPVPACLREHPDLPDELDDILRVVREAPAAWFVRVPALLQRLDRPELLQRALRLAQQRAVAGLAVPQPSLARDTSRLAGATLKITGRQTDALAPRLTLLRTLAPDTLAAQGWQALQQQAVQALSFADLADGSHGRHDLARQAATELDQIRSITACLHAGFSGVLPVIRLGWAEMLSEFDAAPNLRNLASLPRWPEIGYAERREMQARVDWLFDQIEPGQPQAVALVNDVVRMCLLLASHAPVDRIIAGRMARPVTGASPGVRIPLTVLDTAALRIGMQAVLYRAGQIVARAQVEDLGSGEVAARVIHTASARVDLGDDVRVHFDREASVSLDTASARRSLFGRGSGGR